MQNLVDRIRVLCTSLTELEKDVGLSNGAIGKWKKSYPKADNLVLVADYLDCSVDYLLGRTDNVQSHLPSSELPPELQLFSALDEVDRAEVRGLMRGMLKADKYKAK